MASNNIVYFDLETQRSFGDVGGFSHKDKMGVSVAVTFSTARGSYEIYQENEMEKLGEELIRADLVVGWNHLQFDYPVLQPYVFHTLAEQTINLDMMLELETLLGFRLKLDSVAAASLGTGKSADGLDALRWWQEHKKTGDFAPLRKIAEYCALDVKVTKCIHEYALAHGTLKYDDKSGRTAEIAVNWKQPKKEPGSSVGWSRAITWRRPTLTGPVVPLPSALRRFTSGFGMGPGGSTTLWSPEGSPVLSGLGLWGPELLNLEFQI